jgi:hypothetical protein
MLSTITGVDSRVYRHAVESWFQQGGVNMKGKHAYDIYVNVKTSAIGKEVDTSTTDRILQTNICSHFPPVLWSAISRIRSEFDAVCHHVHVLPVSFFRALQMGP